MQVSSADKRKRRRFAGSDRGYKLHDRRLAKFGGSSIRTIKFPLEFEESHGQSEIADAIFEDYARLYGPLNFERYLQDSSTYAFIDLWIDALSSGIVFQDKADSTVGLATKIRAGVGAGSRPHRLERYYDALPAEIRSVIFKEMFLEWLSKGQRMTGGSKEKEFLMMFPEEHRKKFQIRAVTFSQLFGQKIDQRRLFEEKLKLFSLEPIDQIKDGENLNPLNLTFVVLPDFEVQAGILGRGARLRACMAHWKKYFSKLQILSDVEPIAESLDDSGKRKEREELKKTRQAFELKLLGLASNANGLSNFGTEVLGELSRDLDGKYLAKLIDACEKLMGINTPAYRDRVRSVLGQLAVNSKRLGNPALCSGWGYYRSELESRIVSWHSNSFRIISEMPDQISRILLDLHSLRTLSESEGLVPELIEDIVELEPLLERLKEDPHDIETFRFAGALISEINQSASQFWNRYRDQLREVRPKAAELQLKTIGQRSKRRGKAEVDRQYDEKFGSLSKGIGKYPDFFGDNVFRRWEKLRAAPQLMPELMIFLRLSMEILIEQGTTRLEIGDDLESVERRQAQSLYDQIEAVGEIRSLRDIYFKLIAAAKLPRLENRQKLFVARQARRRSEVISFTGVVELKPLLGIISEELDKDPRGKWIELQALLDVAKSLVALAIPGDAAVLRLGERFDGLTPELRQQLPDMTEFVRRWHDELSTPKRALYFLNTYVLSELRGLATTLSKEEFISRATLQQINGQQCRVWLLRSGSQDSDSVPRAEVIKDLRRGLCRYGVSFKDRPTKESQGCGYSLMADSARKRDRTTSDGGVEFSPINEKLAKIRSSVYQTQFLDWAVAPPASRNGRAAVKGSFIIAERVFRFDNQTHTPVRATDNRAERIFCSIPFEITADRPEGDSAAPVEKQRFLGIDVGEKCIAYHIIEVNDRSAQVLILDRGIIATNQYRSLQREVSALQKQQLRGTLSSSSTKIMRLRESLVGYIRNRVHALVLRYRAIPVYEFDISGFETSANKIKKIYESVKIADVRSNNDAQKSFVQHIWGNNIKGVVGLEVRAAGTSQRCSKCKRWFQRDPEIPYDNLKSAKIAFEAETSGELHLATRRLHYYVGREGADAIGAVKNYMRPPLKNLGDEMSAALPTGAAQRRGNSSVYRCPYADCGHISDADLQASLNIAVQGFILKKFRAQQPKNRGHDPEYGEKIRTFASVELSRLVYDPVPLDPKYY